MFTIMFLVCIIVLALLIQTMMGVPPVYFFDLMALLQILLISVPMMLAAGVLKDFFHACTIVNRPKIEYTTEELKKAKVAVDLAGKLVLASGAVQAVISSFAILVTVDDLSVLGPNLAVMLLSLMYALILEIFILPMSAKLNKMIIEQTQREDAQAE